MAALDRVEQIVKTELEEEGLSDQVLWEESQFLYIGYYVVQVVLSDGAAVATTRVLLQKIRETLALEGIELESTARAKWMFAAIGEVQPLYASDGGLRAASVVPVHLKAGSADATANVIVTWAADKAMKELIPHLSLKSVAHAVVLDRLNRGGASAWDPTVEPTIEINAAGATHVSRLLQTAA